jgi:multidrug efflux pump subunit AcrA (membrane-fusion protein)
MLGLVRLALRRPYTSPIAALLILLLGALSITSMIVDIFPIIDIPVVFVAWNYPGLNTEDMERRVVLIDNGALVQNAQTNETSSQPVVTISDDSRVRVDVYLSQSDVPFVHVGNLAEVTDAANENRAMDAHVARTADELDPRTRTLFVELEVDNRNHSLVPGSFVYVTLHAPMQSYPQVPVGSLLIRSGQSFVADVGNDGIVHLRPVKVTSTDGTMVSLADGARIGEQVAVNLPDEVADGGRVQRIDTAGGGKQVAATQTRQ